jgi:hypothetical protein
VQKYEAPDDGHNGVRNMSSSIKRNKIFYDFKTNVHLVGFYSIFSLMMHGTMNVKLTR